MKYMLMLYEADKDWLAAPEDELKRSMAEHEEFAAYLRERGTPFSGGALRPSATATTLRPAAGAAPVVTDGPFVELTEHLGGYYIVEARDLDEALEIARHCPIDAGTEIRPLWEAP
ncbi:YciI family protein [Actinomadura sp. 9N407]|uniref:YciI family protein n=1 Tax=Actinomadura sp. 9N407 TaxID=3375154 RepID=UPI0037AAA40A